MGETDYSPYWSQGANDIDYDETYERFKLFGPSKYQTHGTATTRYKPPIPPPPPRPVADMGVIPPEHPRNKMPASCMLYMTRNIAIRLLRKLSVTYAGLTLQNIGILWTDPKRELVWRFDPASEHVRGCGGQLHHTAIETFFDVHADVDLPKNTSWRVRLDYVADMIVADILAEIERVA